jgi:DNA-binding NarL/FixJ family response regulator
VISDQKLKILLADDHPIVRKGLGLLIQRELDMAVCAEAATADETLSALTKYEPDLLILDLSLKNSNGLELLKTIQRRIPNIPVLVLSVHDENIYAERALRAGANGYIMKHEPIEQVLAAIRCVARGDVYFSDNVRSRLLRLAGNNVKQYQGHTTPGRTSVSSLSNRELQVFEMIGRGHSSSEIARTFGVSLKTIETHMARIKDKLELKNRIALLQSATLWVSKESAI